MVGASRVELPTSRTPSECANLTALRPDMNDNLYDHLKKAREKFEQILNISPNIAN